MLVKHLPGLFEGLKPNLVEQLFLGNDQEIQGLLEILDNKAKAICAALAYQWVARQLLRGNLAPPTGPVFGRSFDLVDKWTIVKKYNQFSNSVKSAQVRTLMLKSTGYKGLMLNKRVLEQPYEAMIGQHESLMLQIVASGAFQPWSQESSDRNVEAMVKGIDDTVLKSYNAERDLKREMTTDIGGLNERDLWPRGFDHYANQDRDFYAILSVKSTSFGHAMGIRFQGSDNSIHFYDPNAGHYRFGNRQKFLTALQLYWMIIWMDDSPGGWIYPDKTQYLRWYLIQYRKKPLDPDLEMFLFDNSGVTV